MSLSPHHGLLCEPLLGHQAHGPICDFGSNHDWDCVRIGCGWYDQQQHILIVVFDPWDLEVDLPQTQGMGWQNPLFPLVPMTDPGARSAAKDSCKTGSVCWIPEHPNQSVQSFPAHPLSLGPH